MARGSEQVLYPKRKRTKRGHPKRRWWVRYEDMTYEGCSASWTGHYRTLIGARVAAFWHQNIGSYGGMVTLKDTRRGKHMDWA